jgi:hypothetical protein
VIVVPPASGPEDGLIPVTLGVGATNVNWSAVEVAELPVCVVTTTSTIPGRLAGVVTLSCVEETTWTVAAATLPNDTDTRPVKLAPLRVRTVPPRVVPEVTVSPVTVGAAT